MMGIHTLFVVTKTIRQPQLDREAKVDINIHCDGVYGSPPKKKKPKPKGK
jgi:hypothetical protein